MIRDVIDVRYMGGLRLWLAFDDGVAGEIDLEPRLDFKGVLESLRDPTFFAKVRVNHEIGTISWPGDLDLDPIVLYAWVTNRDIESILAEKGSMPKTRLSHPR